MNQQFFRKSLFAKFVFGIVLTSFMLSSIPGKGFAGMDKLRPKAANSIQRDGGVSKVTELREGFLKEILGDYKVKATVDNLPYKTYLKKEIDLKQSPTAKTKLAEIFNAPVRDNEAYSILYFLDNPIAFVKKDAKAEIEIKKIGTVKAQEEIDTEDIMPLKVLVEDVEAAKKKGIKAIDIVLNDFLFFEKRANVPYDKRMTLDYRELREYRREEFARKDAEYKEKIKELEAQTGQDAKKELKKLKQEYKQFPEDFSKTAGLQLTGGKGLSLSIMDDVVSVPSGFNVTTEGYFKFVRDNPEVYKFIDEQLKVLDAMDDQVRDRVTKKLRDLMKAASIPQEIETEVLVMYRQLNILRARSGKETPTKVAVRSSGTKEDIKVESWLPITTGSQAGQSDTYLNVSGEKNVLEKLKADWASLFTDRGVSYRDDAIFQMFASRGEFEGKKAKRVYYDLLGKLREYATKLKKPEFEDYADALTNYRSPGSVNLINAVEEMIKFEKNKKDKEELLYCADLLRKIAQEFIHPEQIGIDVVIMQMVRSYLAGVIFSVNPATKMAGVSQAIYKAWNGDKSLVHLDEEGNIVGTKPVVISFEIAYGYGENVVGGKVDPDKFVMSSYDGKNWFFLERHKGTKLIQMINVEKSIDLLKGKLNEQSIRSLSDMVAKAISYDEVDKRINGIIITDLYGIKYLKDLEDKKETEKDKKARLQTIATEIANMIKARTSKDEIKEYIKQNFNVVINNHKGGIKEAMVNDLIDNAVLTVENANKEAKSGMIALDGFFGSTESAEAFVLMVKEVWENKEFDLERRADVLKTLKLDTKEMRNLSYLLRALVDNSFTCNLETTAEHQSRFSINDEEARKIADMAYKITDFYKDQRDIEFAIEIDPDPTVAEKDRLNVYALDVDGKRLGMTSSGKLVELKEGEGLPAPEKVRLKLYNVQARPYTAGFLKVDIMRQRREVDEKFIEENSVRAIANGTKGENATEAYVLVYDSNKTIDWHAATIRRLKAGQFTDEERAQIKKLGFNPDEFGTGKDKVLPIALYLLEADPNHDPIMRLVDAVVTIRGGDTCHAAIFCREQAIPAVTGVGKVVLDGRLLYTGSGIVVDANNGVLYKLETDPKKRIPINFVKFKIKPYGIPGDDDGFAYPTIGQIIASESAAQQNSPIMLADDDAGNSLTRAEFKGEQLGLNVFGGYGYDLIQDINAGRIQMPEKVLIRDLVEGKVKGAEKFISAVNEDIYNKCKGNAAFLKVFKGTFNREYKKEDGIMLLLYFDVAGSAHLLDRTTDLEKNLLHMQTQIPEEINSFIDYQYGRVQRRFNFDYNIITQLQEKPWILKEIESKLIERGYSLCREYFGKEFHTFYNLMGFSIGTDKKAKNRAYDFAQDKIRGMPGSELFSWPGVNPLVGLRGAALETEGVDAEFEGNQKILSFLLEAVIDANENTHNQAWFYVFVRFARELDTLDLAIERIAAKKGKLPKQIGIMIEVPSDAILVKRLSKRLVAMKEKYKKYGVEKIFFSFGTNDYSHLAGKGDREDSRMKLEIMDPAAIRAIKEIKQAGYFYNDKIKRLPLIDEGADGMLQLMEAVVKEAKEQGIELSLCGEALTSLIGRGDYVSAGKIMNLLDSFGISMMSVRLSASMARFDTMAATKEISVPLDQRQVLFDLGNAEVKQNTGVIKGEVIFVDKAQDLLPVELQGLEGAALEERREFLKLQSRDSARSTMRTYNKIVVLNSNLAAVSKEELENAMGSALFEQFEKEGLLKPLGNSLYIWSNLNVHAKKFSAQLKERGFKEEERNKIMEIWQKSWDNTIEGLERRGIDWDDLQYAKAIIVDKNVNLEGWDVLRADKGIIPLRVKAVAEGIGALRSQLEGQFVTIDYAAKKIYQGNLKVEKKASEIRALPIPKVTPQVDTKIAVSEDANTVYKAIQYHPLALLAYEKEQLKGEKLETTLGKIFDEYVTKLADELDNLSKEKFRDKKLNLLNTIQEKVSQEPERVIKEFLQERIESINRGNGLSLSKNWLEELRAKYFSEMRARISRRLNSNSARDYIKESFKRQMQEAISNNKGKFVVHKTTSLNSLVFRNMAFGFLMEQVNPNPDYGLLGADRAIGDMWEINRLELEAFKEVWEALHVDERKNFGLQITELKGTQSGAVVIAWKYVLKDLGIVPGENGLEVGVNISTAIDTLVVDKYFEHFANLGKGLSFVTYDRFMLGAAWPGVDVYWDEWRRLGREEDLNDIGDIAISIVNGKIEEANKNLGSQAKKTIVAFEQGLSAKDGGVATPERVILDKDDILGLPLDIKFNSLGNNVWAIGQLTMDGLEKKADDRTFTTGKLPLQELLYDQQSFVEFLRLNGDQVAYKMYRDLAASLDDRRIIQANGLRYDITVIPALTIGKEPVKTYGHYHPAAGIPGTPGIDQSYTEVYVVLSGEAIYYLQKVDKDGNVVDAIQINAKAGDIVPIPATYGHVTINSSPDQHLVMMNWVADYFSSVYGEITNLKGSAYYFVRDDAGLIKALPNPAYGAKKVAKLKQKTVSAAEAAAVGLPKGTKDQPMPVYDVIHEGREADLKKLVAFLGGHTALREEGINLPDKSNFKWATDANVKWNPFLGALKNVQGAKGALVIGADTIFENAGILSALKQLKQSAPGLQIVVWAQNQAQINKLKFMELEKIVDIFVSDGLKTALASLERRGFANERIVLINSQKDIETIKKDLKVNDLAEVIKTRPGLKAVDLETATGANVNIMPLAVARAASSILKDEKEVVNQYQAMNKEYADKKLISSDDLAKLNDLTSEITKMPIVKATEDVAKAQVSYAETWAKI